MEKRNQLLRLSAAIFILTAFVAQVFGQAETENPAFPFWKIKGNSNIDSAQHFLGTTDANNLTFRTNNIRRMTIDAAGSTGFNTTVPNSLGTVEATNIGGNNAIFISTNYGNPNEFWFRRSQGTISAPTIIGSAGSIMRLLGKGYDGAAFQNAAQIEFLVDSNSGTGNMPGRIAFSTTPALSTTLAERMRITRNGLVGVNATVPATYLDVNGDLALRQGTLTLVNGDNNNIVTANNPFPAGKSFYRVTGPSSDFNITGIADGQDGRILVLFNDASDTMNIINLSTSSNPNNKINTTGNTLAIPVKGSVVLEYDITSNHWIVTGYNNGDFGNASTSTNWTINGNSGTSASTNFLGTTDAADLAFRVNNEKSGLIQKSVTGNTFFGHKTASIMTSGVSNALFGNRVLEGWDGGNNNSIFGAEAGSYVNNGIGDNNSLFGYRAGYHIYNIKGISAFGTEAGFANNNGVYNSYFGYRAGYNNLYGSNNSFFGDSSGFLLDNDLVSTGDDQNTFVGAKAGLLVTAGGDNTFAGFQTGIFNTGSGNTFVGSQASSGFNGVSQMDAVTAIGYHAGYYSQASKNTFVGYQAGSNNYTATSSTMVGYAAGLNSRGSNNTFIGDSAGSMGDVNIYQNVFVGSKAGADVMFGFKNTALGYLALSNSFNPGASVNYTTAIGTEAGQESNGCNSSAFVGYRSGYNSFSSTENTAIGAESASYLTSSGKNVLAGFKAGYSMGNSTRNVILGHESTEQLTTSIDNVLIGANSAGNTFNNSNKNVLIGANRGSVNNLSQSVHLGENIIPNGGTYITLLGNSTGTTGFLTNATAVGASTIVSQDNALILGNGADIGIGTSTPARKLHVSGATNGVRFGGLATGGSFINAPSATTDKIMFADANGDIRSYANGTSGQTLTINASGIPAWTNSSSYAWLTTGNSLTVDGTNYLGTFDNIPFNIRVNNTKAGRIDNTNHNVSFGYESIRSITSATNLTAVGDSTQYSTTTGTDNTAFGARALRRNTTGSNNVALGRSSMHFNTTGSHLVGLGSYTLYNITTGTSATAVGDSTLYSLTTGTLNTAVGYGAMERTNTGINNTALGFHALYFNTSGYNNNASGVETMFNNSTGFDNAAYGFGSMYTNTTGNDNAAFGFYALTNNLNGDSNTAVGSFALYGATNSTGNSNVGVGELAGRNTSSGSNNIFIGAHAAQQNSSGTGNVIIGLSSAFQNTSGNYNATLGTKALLNNTTGSYNIAIGDSALYTSSTAGKSVAVGTYALLNNTGGSNTAAGFQGLVTNTTGTFNTAVGYSADVNTGALTNATAIGAFARVDASNTLILGSVSGINGAGSTVNVGIGTNSPLTRLELNGALSLDPSAVVTANSDLFAVTVANQSYIKINSDDPVGSNRTITLSAGLTTGQILVVECAAGSNQIEFLDGTGNVQAGGSVVMDGDDVATFVWNGTSWLMMSFHAN